MESIYTIGHSTHPTERFLQLLLKHNINCIVDVRSTPYSKYASQYNRDQIKQFLRRKNIRYIFLGEELGARRKNANLYNKGYLDFEGVISSDQLFKSGIDRLKVGITSGFKIALMCTEKDPIDCHRSILISKALEEQGLHVEHIKESGTTETQRQLETRLVDNYFPGRQQQTILDLIDGEESAEELLAKAYKMKNEEIGYKLDGELQEG